MATDVTYATNIDLSGNELRNARAHILSGAPTGAAGKFYYDSVANKLMWHNGTTWISAGGAELANLSGQGTALMGQTAVNGSAATAARSDHVHAMPAKNSILLNELGLPSASVAMNSQKITGLAAAAANGDAVRYEQVIGQFLSITGGTVTGDVTIQDSNTLSDTILRVIAPESSGKQGIIELEGAGSSGVVQFNVNAVPYWRIAGNATNLVLGTWDGASPTTSMLVAYATGNVTFSKPVAMSSNKITGLADGTASTDAVTKQQMEAAISAAQAGLDVKQSVRTATTVPIALTGLITVGGTAVGAGDRVLVKDQGDDFQNGIYIAASGAWTRAPDFNSATNITPGAFCFVEGGTLNDTGWVMNQNTFNTLGSDPITFTQFSGAGEYVWGNGLANSGSTISVGAGTGISVAADSVSVDIAVVARKYSVTLGAAATSHVITHNLNTQDVNVTVRKLSDQSVCITAWEATSVNTVTVYFATATGNTHRVTVMG